MTDRLELAVKLSYPGKIHLGRSCVIVTELLTVREEHDAWNVVAGYFEELDVVDGEAADLRPPTKENDERGVAATL